MHINTCTFRRPSHSACVRENVSVGRMFIWWGQIWWLDMAAASPFPDPWRNAYWCVCAWIFFFFLLRCVFVFDWCETVGDARAVLNQTCIGSDTAEPMVWQACDRAALVLNDFLGSITLPKHWTCHLPFPISPSWSQSLLLFTNGALIAPRFSLSTD